MIQEKRASILCIMLVLLEKTDEDHKMTQAQIAEEVEKRYGLTLERKSISNAIDIINSCFEPDCDIEFTKTSKGIYCSRRLFEFSQLAYLADSVFNNKSLSDKEAEDILEKLCKLTFDSDGALKARYDQAKDFGRLKGYHTFYNYTTISQALKEHTQISFNYVHHYDDKDEEVLSIDPKTKQIKKFNLSPYYLVMGNNGKHYVIGARYYDKPLTLSPYKIEYMRNIELKRKYQRKNKQEVFGEGNNFLLAKYLEQHPKMFLREQAVDCDVLILQEKGTVYIRDEFGVNVSFRRKADGLHALFKTTPSALKLFAMDYFECVTILQPAEVRQEVYKSSLKIAKKYSKEI